MNNNQKFLAGVILGAAAGAALALFFNSDKVKEVLANAKDAANKLGNDIKDKMQNLDEELNSLIEKGKSFVADLEKKSKETSNA
jgi:gas vesicle protein